MNQMSYEEIMIQLNENEAILKRYRKPSRLLWFTAGWLAATLTLGCLPTPEPVIDTNKETVVLSDAVEVEQTPVAASTPVIAKEPTQTPVQTTGDTLYLGNFKISAYCHCVQCCGKSDGITATGTKVAANRTIAVDPKVIPLGSRVVIDGQIYIAEDTGGAIKGNRIDMYFATHQEALNFGIRYKDVSLVKSV